MSAAKRTRTTVTASTSASAAASLSQACFLIPAASNVGAAAEDETNDGDKRKEALGNGGFQRLMEGEEPLECAQFRRRRYLEDWKDIQTYVRNHNEAIHQQVFERIIQFVETASADLLKTIGEQNSSIRPFREVPTGLVCTGINFLEQEEFFRKIATTLSSKSNKYRIATLKSKDSVSFKTAFQQIACQMLGQSEGVDKQSEENATPEQELLTPKASAALLRTMFIEQFQKQNEASSVNGAGGIGSSTNARRLPIRNGISTQCSVIILLDVECFDSKVVQDLITVFSDAQEQTPVVFLFGIGTTPSIIHQIVPGSTMVRISAEKFFLESPSRSFEQLISTFFVSTYSGFKLGTKSYHWLQDMFTLYNYSTEQFLRSLHFALLEYYYAEPLSILCPSFGNDSKESLHDKVQSAIKLLTEDHYELIRILPSFQRYAENFKNSPNVLKQLLSNDDYLAKELPSLLYAITSYHKHLEIGTEILVLMQECVGNANYKKTFRALYSMNYETGLCDSEYLKSVVQLFCSLSTTEISSSLKVIYAALEKSDKSTTFIQEFVKNLREIEAKFSNLRMASLPIKTDFLNQLKQCFQNFFQQHLHHYSLLPLHEIVYFDRLVNLKKALNPPLRTILQTALAKPDHYLSSCTKLGDLPDVAILYDCYCQSGKKINVHDMYVSFCTIVHSKADPASDVGLRARFSRALAELELIGFVKPMKNTDFVERLVWD